MKIQSPSPGLPIPTPSSKGSGAGNRWQNRATSDAAWSKHAACNGTPGSNRNQELLARPAQRLHRVETGAHQIAHRFVSRIGNPHRRQYQLCAHSPVDMSWWVARDYARDRKRPDRHFRQKFISPGFWRRPPMCDDRQERSSQFGRFVGEYSHLPVSLLHHAYRQVVVSVCHQEISGLHSVQSAVRPVPTGGSEAEPEFRNHFCRNCIAHSLPRRQSRPPDAHTDFRKWKREHDNSAPWPDGDGLP